MLRSVCVCHLILMNTHTYMQHITQSGKEGGLGAGDLQVPCAWPLPLPCAWPPPLPVCASTNFRHSLISSASSASLCWHMRMYVVYACCLCLLRRIFLRIWGICWANNDHHFFFKFGAEVLVVKSKKINHLPCPLIVCHYIQARAQRGCKQQLHIQATCLYIATCLYMQQNKQLVYTCNNSCIYKHTYFCSKLLHLDFADFTDIYFLKFCIPLTRFIQIWGIFWSESIFLVCSFLIWPYV
jgi:hypothetical protein